MEYYRNSPTRSPMGSNSQFRGGSSAFDRFRPRTESVGHLSMQFHDDIAGRRRRSMRRVSIEPEVDAILEQDEDEDDVYSGDYSLSAAPSSNAYSDMFVASDFKSSGHSKESVKSKKKSGGLLSMLFPSRFKDKGDNKSGTSVGSGRRSEQYERGSDDNWETRSYSPTNTLRHSTSPPTLHSKYCAMCYTLFEYTRHCGRKIPPQENSPPQNSLRHRAWKNS